MENYLKEIQSTNISDFLTADFFAKLSSFSPSTREEYLAHMQLVYNLKLNTKFPLVVHVETTNSCNQKCIMCQHPSMTRKKQNISPELAYKAIDESIKEKAWFLHFFFFGEPFLNKKTLEYMKYARDKGMENISLTTNFTTISENEIEKLVDYEINSVHISFEGLNRDLYKKIRKTDHYDKVISNIQTLIEYKKKKNSLKPWIALTYVRTIETDEEINQFKNTWGDLVNDIHISPQFDYLGRAEIIEYQEAVNSEGILNRDIESRQACRQLWLRMVVLSNGDLVPCSQNMDGELSVGNIKDISIAEAWNNHEMNDLRIQHLANQYKDDCICKNCIDWDWSGKIDDRPKLDRKKIL